MSDCGAVDAPSGIGEKFVGQTRKSSSRARHRHSSRNWAHKPSRKCYAGIQEFPRVVSCLWARTGGAGPVFYGGRKFLVSQRWRVCLIRYRSVQNRKEEKNFEPPPAHVCGWKIPVLPTSQPQHAICESIISGGSHLRVPFQMDFLHNGTLRGDHRANCVQ